MEEADRYFARAGEEIAKTTFDETGNEIRLSYAQALMRRGLFERSTEYFRMLADSRPRSRPRGAQATGR